MTIHYLLVQYQGNRRIGAIMDLDTREAAETMQANSHRAYRAANRLGESTDLSTRWHLVIEEEDNGIIQDPS